MAQPGVTGTGVGLGTKGELVLRIYTTGILQTTRDEINKKLAGVPVDWEEGDIVPQ